MLKPRVRIAPSPSGNLHVGTARTALFNYLFAKKHNGSFILRIEDTDIERSQEVYVQNIYDSLKALGLSWDEGPDCGGEYGPYVQSQRLELYVEKAHELRDKGYAYNCYCTPEELEAAREQAKAQNNDCMHNCDCHELTEEKILQYIEEGRTVTIRFKVPHKEIKLQDIIRGEVSFDCSLINDFVLIKSNGTPTYNFAVVVDDIAMKISHVIRGEDHVSNTPRQIMLYEAFGVELPKFAHVGMILAPDKSKLSKRHGATAVNEFIEQGYLPEAFVNFLALLGWSPPDGDEIKTLQEIIDSFELERVSKSPAIFDLEKLNWLNGIYIRKLPIEDITNRCKHYMYNYDLSLYDDSKIQTMISSFRERFTTLKDTEDAVCFFFDDNIICDETTKAEALGGDHVKEVLEKFLELTEEMNFDDAEAIGEQFVAFRKAMKPLKPKLVMWPVRYALTGRTHGADLNVIIALLGKEKVQQRIKETLATLQTPC
jgi:glutamyl-tRNA synthetase